MKSQRGQPGIFSSRKPENATAELGISNLSLRFGGVRALNNIDLEVHTGEFVAVIGPNGAGKTSLLNCITGFYRPQKGRIILTTRISPDLPPHRYWSRSVSAGPFRTSNCFRA